MCRAAACCRRLSFVLASRRGDAAKRAEASTRVCHIENEDAVRLMLKVHVGVTVER
jgi:hypothetical protein